MSRNLLLTLVILFIGIPILFWVFRSFTTSQFSLFPTRKTAPVPASISIPAQKGEPTEEERDVLSIIAKSDADRSLEEKEQFSQALSKAAVVSGQLDLTSCSPNPLVLMIEAGKKLTVLNADPTDHTLTINGENFQIPAKGSLNITTDFGEANRVYPYSCDQNSLAGVIWLQRKQ